MNNKLYIHQSKGYTYNELISMAALAKEGLSFIHKDCAQLPKQRHPLLNPDSNHYEMIGGVQAINLMEAMFTVEELMAWAKLTAMKYRLRIGDKDTPEKEIAKIKTFEAYYKYLENKQ